MKNVLIIATHGLGDLVMLLPVLKGYSFTGLKVTILLKGKAEQDLLLSIEIPFRVNILLFSEYSSIRKKISLIKYLRSHYLSYVIPQIGISRAKYALLFFLLKKVRFTSYPTFLRYLFFRVDKSKHKVLVNYEIFGFTNIKCDFMEKFSYPELKFSSNEELSIIDQSFPDYKNIIIAPGSGILEAHKRWSRDKYALLVDRLLEVHDDVVITVVGSSSELELISYIKNRCIPNNRLIFQPGTLSISQLLLLITKAKLVLSNCNGVSHLAALCQTHIIGLYGPTDPEFTGPFGVSFDSVRLNLDCSPCYNKDYQQGCGNPICMEGISVKKVFNIVNNHLIKTI
jgi:ADP-heptose:LPS heptosyltransferase